MSTVNLSSLQQRFDRVAIHQLRAEIAKLSDQLEQTKLQLAAAEDRYADAENRADFWWEQATDMQLQLCEVEDARTGLTQSGQLVLVKGDE